jgi:hypothetical protein
MINVHRKRNVDRVLNEEKRVFMIKHKLIQALIHEWVIDCHMNKRCIYLLI